MASQADDRTRKMRLRYIGWGTAVLLIVLPFSAMEFTREVRWNVGDFLVLAALLALFGLPLELVARLGAGRFYAGALALALAGAFLISWVNLAVGIVGSENNPANLLFFAALLVGTLTGAVNRFSSIGMFRSMAATLVALTVAFTVAILLPSDEPKAGHLPEFAGETFLMLFFVASALLFRRAARPG